MARWVAWGTDLSKLSKYLESIGSQLDDHYSHVRYVQDLENE